MADCFELQLDGSVIQSVTTCDYVLLSQADYDALAQQAAGLSAADISAIAGSALLLFATAFVFRLLFNLLIQPPGRN